MANNTGGSECFHALNRRKPESVRKISQSIKRLTNLKGLINIFSSCKTNSYPNEQCLHGRPCRRDYSSDFKFECNLLENNETSKCIYKSSIEIREYCLLESVESSETPQGGEQILIVARSTHNITPTPSPNRNIQLSNVIQHHIRCHATGTSLYKVLYGHMCPGQKRSIIGHTK